MTRRTDMIAVLAVTLLLVTLPTLPVAANDPDEPPAIDTLSGEDRYATAAAIARDRAQDGDIDFVVLATGTSFADALSAGPFSTGSDVVMLLTRRDVLPAATDEVLRELTSTGALDAVFVAGGPVAISDDVVQLLLDYTDDVFRLAGEDRYETSVAFSEFRDPVPVVAIASGVDYPDALSGGALAGLFGWPLLLVPPTGGATPAVQEELCRLAPQVTYVLGGPAAVGEDTIQHTDCLGTVRRLSGDTRFDTAATLSQLFHEYGPTVVLTTGRAFPDGLAGAGFAASQGAPLLLVEKDEVPAPAACEIIRLEPSRIRVLGGRGAVADAVIDTAFRLEAGDAATYDCPDEGTTVRHAHITDNHRASDLSVSPNGRWAWLVSGTQAHRIDLDTRRRTNTFNVTFSEDDFRPNAAASVGALDDGRAVVFNVRQRDFVVIDPRTGAQDLYDYREPNTNNEGGTFHINVTTDGRVFGLNTSVYEFDPDTGETARFSTGIFAQGLAVSGDGTTGVVWDQGGSNGTKVQRIALDGSGPIGDEMIVDRDVRSVATDRTAERIVLDGTGLIDGRSVFPDRFDWGVDDGFPAPQGGVAMSEDGLLAFAVAGNALCAIEIDTGSFIDCTYVPLDDGWSARSGQPEMEVTTDLTRAVMAHPGGVVVVDELIDEHRTGESPFFGDARTSQSAATTAEQLRSRRGR